MPSTSSIAMYGLVVVVADVEDRDDVRVRQHARALGLAQEARAVLAVGRELRLEQLDRDARG